MYELVESDLKQSEILDANLVKDLINLCGFSFYQEWKLIYRANQSSFSGGEFHSVCDDIPHTLTLVKTFNGNIFGGYTQETWENTDKYKRDPAAFLFSLVNRENQPLKIKIDDIEVKHAIFCDTDGPCFGREDIIIYTENNILQGDSFLGRSYKHPYHVADSDQARAFLAGSAHFFVAQTEIYQKV